jgi:hypothetical protein
MENYFAHHYHVGYRQPGEEPEGEVTTFPNLAEAIAQNKLNAEESLAGLVGTDNFGGEWTLSGPDEDGDYFVTLVRDGEETFSWHHFVEVCGDAHDDE